MKDIPYHKEEKIDLFYVATEDRNSTKRYVKERERFSLIFITIGN